MTRKKKEQTKAKPSLGPALLHTRVYPSNVVPVRKIKYKATGANTSAMSYNRMTEEHYKCSVISRANSSSRAHRSVANTAHRTAVKKNMRMLRKHKRAKKNGGCLHRAKCLREPDADEIAAGQSETECRIILGLRAVLQSRAQSPLAGLELPIRSKMESEVGNRDDVMGSRQNIERGMTLAIREKHDSGQAVAKVEETTLAIRRKPDPVRW